MHVVQILLALLAVSPVLAQVTVTSPTELRAAPGGTTVATITAGTEVRARETRGPETRVRLEGWLHRDLLGGRRDTFALSVRAPSGAFLRASPTVRARALASLRNGMGVIVVSRKGDWVRVRREAWVATTRLREDTTPQRETRAGAVETAPQAIQPPAASPSPNALTPARETTIRSAPSGAGLGSLSRGAMLVPLARDREWIRVRFEGWVQERELETADTTVQTRLSAADLRADPDGTRGVLVRWNVQVLSPVQRADPLRRELAENEPYVIARGPDGESALLYLAVPPSLLDAVASISPLTGVVITAKVRSGRSAPVGVPILDLLSIVRR
jgi:SH3-like domain-containing protein